MYLNPIDVMFVYYSIEAICGPLAYWLLANDSGE